MSSFCHLYLSLAFLPGLCVADPLAFMSSTLSLVLEIFPLPFSLSLTSFNWMTGAYIGISGWEQRANYSYLSFFFIEHLLKKHSVHAQNAFIIHRWKHPGAKLVTAKMGQVSSDSAGDECRCFMLLIFWWRHQQQVIWQDRGQKYGLFKSIFSAADIKCVPKKAQFVHIS